jgi:hypothetical protein
MNRSAGQIVRTCLAAVLILAGSPFSVGAQEVKRPPLRVPEIADTAVQLVPPGWRVDTGMLIEGDLNGDGRADAALVISNGAFDATGVGESSIVKHVLVLALRGDDGKLRRSVVNDAMVLDGDEGGAFGDPFQSLSVERGAVVIMHYGGSRDRWGYTHRYRYQNGQWMLIALSFGNTDSLDLDHYDNCEIDLTTGLVEASEKGDYEGRPKKPEISGAYYELEVLPVDKGPHIDGSITPGEWPGYTVSLNEKGQVYRRRQLWRGRDDLSAQLHAVRSGKDLFVSAEVIDNEVSAGDAVRLVTRRGLVLKPLESKIRPSGKGYVFEARYAWANLARASTLGETYAVEAVGDQTDPLAGAGDDLEGFQLPVAVEILDVDHSAAPKARSVLSTRLVGSPYNGAFRIFRAGRLVLVSDIEPMKP